ncbi:hypothetical protein, partial [Streptomyces scabiei]|uniref:hypothetical protein n=1 Tax=Streptomyces scabiei TaxID=1930 RepID=UPI001C4EF1F2
GERLLDRRGLLADRAPAPLTARARTEPVQRGEQLFEAVGVAVVVPGGQARPRTGRDQNPVGLVEPGAECLADG